MIHVNVWFIYWQCFPLFSSTFSLDVGSVEGLAYHRAWETVYWTSSTTSSISRHTVDQSRHGAFRRQPVVTLSEDDHPHVLALDECQKSVISCFHFYTPTMMTYCVNNSTTTNHSNQELRTLQRRKTKTKNKHKFFLLNECKQRYSKLFQREKVLSWLMALFFKKGRWGKKMTLDSYL